MASVKERNCYIFNKNEVSTYSINFSDNDKNETENMETTWVSKKSFFRYGRIGHVGHLRVLKCQRMSSDTFESLNFVSMSRKEEREIPKNVIEFTL